MMTVRRFSPLWSLLPLVSGLLLLALSLFGALALRSLAGLCLLAALPVSSVLLFGGLERRYWVVAAVLALAVGVVVFLLNAWLTVQLLLATGAPGRNMTETTAVLIFLGALVAVFSALATSLVCGLGWLRRPVAPPLP